ncbi:glycosyl hydrolase family 16 [Nocardioides sp. J9]|uniref:glycoside hydrolase family 16 protein n=1 Tax=Nocardioides sp. J9 TaxID=935844 RepID=UPI0011A2682B|nr:glycoside hydrolase family 16 protein [Nocardioides sp. J9]TWH03954.1 glycosyl hydrolase family 16 [Nocardioides sp. J9]
MGTEEHFDERFEQLDPARWTSSYLPAWSSRAAAAAAYDVGPGGLRLSIPPDHPRWCPDTHATPLRVSGIHSANRSGPVGSTDAPQPFAAGLRVREEQPTMVGFAPHFGVVEVTCRAHLTGRSMFSAWMVGLEDRPERSGEICLVEVFGNSIGDDGTVALGQGIHPFRDPGLVDDFTAERRSLDVAQWHRYAVRWSRGAVELSVDGQVTRTCSQAPDYPMMLILAVFDFPDEGGDPADVPVLEVRRVVGSPLS